VGGIQELNTLLAAQLGCDPADVYERIELLFNQLLAKKQLHSYGMKAEEIESFADSVLKTQGRLLANNYVELSRDEIRDIYQSLF
jgi:4-hydroxybutyrate dehydrogenase